MAIYGVWLRITPNLAGQSPYTVLEQADDDAGSPDAGTWAEIGTYYKITTSFTVLVYLPNDGARKHWRVFHELDGHTDSSTTGTVDAKPAVFPSKEPEVPIA
jgi:hypothetical protein